MTSVSVADLGHNQRVGTCQVQVCPGGPALVRGADEVLDSSGTAHPTTRPLVAVCLCGRSQRAPWCDGTHKVVTADAPPPPVVEARAD
jgi:CDGSH-type Zn-finger protein